MTDDLTPEAPKPETTRESAPVWFEPMEVPESAEHAENLRILTEAVETSSQTFDLAHYLRLFGGPTAVVDATQPLPH